MKAIIVAFLGLCLVFVAHGIPLGNTNHDGIISARLGDMTKVSSSYSSLLSFSSGMFERVGGDSGHSYYFQAIQVTVPTTGTYAITSDSDLDTIGYLYDSSFDPSDPTVNLITDDDDGGDIPLQFHIEALLESGHTYILVVTTHAESHIGSFLISTNGPDSVELVEITPATSRPMTIPSIEPSASSSYSSVLSANSGAFQRVGGNSQYSYYFQAIQVTAPIAGTYTFTSNSYIDPIGYLYDSSFDPSDPTVNLITDDDDGGANPLQFHIEAFLQAGHTYILVVTTHGESDTGSFSISTDGPDSVELVAITPTTSRPMTIPTIAPVVSSSYSSSLSPSSSVFQRVDGDTDVNYYYQAIQVTAPTTGTYSFTSYSILDTIGYFYDSSFEPANPTENLIMDDDDSGDNHLQFRIEPFLESGHTYILVVTTHAETETGSFSISVTGPAQVDLISITH